MDRLHREQEREREGENRHLMHFSSFNTRHINLFYRRERKNIPNQEQTMNISFIFFIDKKSSHLLNEMHTHVYNIYFFSDHCLLFLTGSNNLIMVIFNTIVDV